MSGMSVTASDEMLLLTAWVVCTKRSLSGRRLMSSKSTVRAGVSGSSGRRRRRMPISPFLLST